MSADSANLFSLHLPRIICLHGGGTNARIFRMQCRGLERALRSSFRLVFAEAPFAALPGPDVTAVYKDCGPFKAWLRIRPDETALDASTVVQEIADSLAAARRDDDARGATGEWVGLLGFSQGAKLAASILYEQQLRLREKKVAHLLEYRFAVLLAGRGPLVSLNPARPVPRGLVNASQPTMSPLYESEDFMNSVDYQLHIPTIHVHGLNDPGLELHRRLLDRYCDSESTMLLEWDGAHRVPIKAKDVNYVVKHIMSLAQTTSVLDW